MARAPRSGPGLLDHGPGRRVVGLAVVGPGDDRHHLHRPRQLEGAEAAAGGGHDVGHRGRRSPAASDTTAATRWPKRSSAKPSTRQSSTAGWHLTASSTSWGNTFSPPVLMHCDPRPRMVTLPVGADRGPVAGKGVAHAVDHPEGGRRLGLVPEVALGTPTERATRPCSRLPGCSSRSSSENTFTPSAGVNWRRRHDVAGPGDGHAHDPLARRDVVEDDHPGHELEKGGADLGREDGARRGR